MKRMSTLGLTVVLMLWGAAAQAVELMHWERLPLAVPLVVNQERVVFVDEDVRVGVPSTLTGKLRVQSTGGTLYLRASEAIAPTRLQLQSVTTGEIILLDIAATPGDQPLEPVRILKNAQGQATETESSAVPVPERTPIPVALRGVARQSDRDRCTFWNRDGAGFSLGSLHRNILENAHGLQRLIAGCGRDIQKDDLARRDRLQLQSGRCNGF